MEEDGFKLVKHGGRRRGQARSGLPRKGKTFLERMDGLNGFGPNSTLMAIGSIRIDTADELRLQIAKCCHELRHEGYLEQVRRSMDRCLEARGGPIFEEIVCFGLGNFTRCAIALYQMALVVAMKDELQYSDQVLLYDPCFSAFEAEALRSFGFHLLPENTECRYPVRAKATRPTLFFMPHMYGCHYNNLLESNWLHLHQAVIYSNSFEVVTSSLYSLLGNQQDFEYLLKLNTDQCPYEITECRVQNEFSFNDIFNQLSIHTFTKKLKTTRLCAPTH